MFDDIMALNRAAFGATRGAARLTAKALHGGVRLGAAGMDHSRRVRDRALSAQGFLAPGDGPAPPGASVLDYRGMADVRSVTLPADGVPLGQLVHLRRGAVRPVALPPGSLLRHACVIGPPGSGKTFSTIIPWTAALLSAGCSVVTIDVKGDFYDELTAYTTAGGQRLGVQGLLWDYASTRTHRWNFLQEITNDQQLEAAVVSILGKKRDGDTQPFFYQRDYRWLKGLMRLSLEAHGSRARPAHLLDLLEDLDLVAQLLPHSASRSELTDLVSLAPQEAPQHTSGLLNALSIFRQPEVARAVSASDFSLADVMSQPTLLVAVAKLSDARRAEQMSSLLLSQLSLAVLARFGAHPRRPVVFMIDEAPRLKDRIDLEQLLSVVRGADAGVVLAAQDVGQFGSEQQQSALLANCHTYISMAGVSPASAQYLSNRLGTMPKEEYSVAVGGQRRLLDQQAQTRQMTVAPVLGPREIMYPPSDRWALVHSHSAGSAPFFTDVTRR